MKIQLRSTLDADAPRARGKANGAYPLIDKVYDLGLDHLKENGIEPDSDEWVLEVDYEEIAPYPPPMRVDDQQRVSVALELFDESDAAVSPQAAVQILPLANTMIRLGGTKQPIWSPIKIPTG